jgi:predicted transcriptional regulator
MPSRSDYTKTLDRLSQLLRRKPMTARAIAEHMNCRKPTAYQRLRDLQKRGEEVFTTQVRESDTGPLSTAYSVRT